MISTRASVFLTQTPYTPQSWGGDGLARRFRAQYEAGTRRPFALVDSARDADLVLYCEDYQESESTFAPKLRAERDVAEFPEKVFVISGEDRPLGFLPGVYVSMPRARFDDRRFRSGAYFGDINPQIAAAELERDTPRRWLFSFIGARTAPVRSSLFETFRTTDRWWIQETGNAQYNIGVDDPAKKAGQQAYLRIMLESDFVLCPRGHGTSSFRLFETMRLGRVPVILGDEWVAPIGPVWPDCSIRVAEREIARLPDILAARQPWAEEMGRRARAEWEAWFSPAVYTARCLEWIHDLRLARTADERDQQAHWPRLLHQAAKEQAKPNPALNMLRRLKNGVRRRLPTFR